MDIRETTNGYFIKSVFLSYRVKELLAIHPNHRELALYGGSTTLGGHGEFIYLIDLETGENIVRLRRPGVATTGVYFHDGRFLLLGGRHRAWLVDIPSNYLPITLEGQEGEVSAVAFSPKGDLVAAGSTDGAVRVWGVIR